MTITEILLFAPLALAGILASTSGFHGPAGRHRRNR